MTAQHIPALVLETGRAQDKVRLLEFIEGGAPNRIQILLVKCQRPAKEVAAATLTYAQPRTATI